MSKAVRVQWWIFRFATKSFQTSTFSYMALPQVSDSACQPWWKLPALQFRVVYFCSSAQYCWCCIGTTLSVQDTSIARGVKNLWQLGAGVHGERWSQAYNGSFVPSRVHGQSPMQLKAFYRASSYASAILVVVILSVCSSVCHTHVCTKTKQCTAHILVPHERAITLVVWHQQRFVDDPLLSEICAQSDPPLSKTATSTDFGL